MNYGRCWRYWSESVEVEFGVLKTLLRWLLLDRVHKWVENVAKKEVAQEWSIFFRKGCDIRDGCQK